MIIVILLTEQSTCSRAVIIIICNHDYKQSHYYLHVCCVYGNNNAIAWLWFVFFLNWYWKYTQYTCTQCLHVWSHVSICASFCHLFLPRVVCVELYSTVQVPSSHCVHIAQRAAGTAGSHWYQYNGLSLWCTGYTRIWRGKLHVYKWHERTLLIMLNVHVFPLQVIEIVS